MIDVDVTLDGHNILRNVRSSGHSGYAHKGSDIVCAGVSAFVQTGYIVVKRLLGDDVTLSEDSSEPHNVLEYRLDDYPDDLVQHLQGITVYMLTGLNELHRQYSEYIRVNIK